MPAKTGVRDGTIMVSDLIRQSPRNCQAEWYAPEILRHAAIEEALEQLQPSGYDFLYVPVT